MLKYFKRIFTGTAEEFNKIADKALLGGEKLFIVTANAEILMKAEGNDEIDSLLMAEDTAIVPDGISIVKALNKKGFAAKERVTGVELCEHLFEAAGKSGKSIFLLGAKEEIVKKLSDKIKKKYHGININYRNGYDGDKDEIFEEIKRLSPDLIIVALGVPAQELLISKHLDSFEKGVFVGAGGSFDVLSGEKMRAPQFFIKTNTEWLYRIAKEPWRLKRFYENNIKFMKKLSKL